MFIQDVGYELGELYAKQMKRQLSLAVMGTSTGLVMTLANSIIGVSVLAMPFCYKQCGIVLASLMLIVSSIMSRLACYYLIKSAVIARRKNFEFLAFYTFGPTGKLTVELSIIGFMLGTCVAFFVVMGDLGPAILGPALGVENPSAIRPTVLIAIAVFVVLPLGLLRNVDSLAAISAVTIAFYICLVLKVMGEATTHLVAWDWLDKVHLWRPAGLLQCIPIFSMALSCQTQLFEIFDSVPNASIDKMNGIVRSAVNLCTLMYMAMGLFGYIAFCTQPFSGNLMLSFSPTPTSEVIKMGFVLSVAVSFPLVIFPCRASLHSLLFRRGTPPHYELLNASNHMSEGRFKVITLSIVAVSLGVGLVIPNIELVLGLVGSTIGVLVCVIIPATAFLCLTTKNNNERLLAQILCGMGILIMVLGSYANLYATEEVISGSEPVQQAKVLPVETPVELPVLNLVPDEPNSKVKIKDDALKNIKNVEQLAAALPKLIESAPTPPPVDTAAKEKADVRKEPPVPEAPEVKVVSEKVAEPKEIGVKENPVIVSEVKNPEPPPAVDKVEPKKEEIIDRDAIKKEDDEIKEVQKQEILKKKEALIEKFEENAQKQQKILEEQKKILEDMKIEKEKFELEKDEVKLKIPAAGLQSKKVNDENLHVINAVAVEDKKESPIIDNKVPDNRPLPIDNIKPAQKVMVEERVPDMIQDNIIKKNIAEGVPLPIAIQNVAPHIVKPAKIVDNPLNPNEGNVESKMPRRDILGDHEIIEQREKRDIEETINIDLVEREKDANNVKLNQGPVKDIKPDNLPEEKVKDKVDIHQLNIKEELPTNNDVKGKDLTKVEKTDQTITQIKQEPEEKSNNERKAENDTDADHCPDKNKSSKVKFSDNLVPLDQNEPVDKHLQKELKSDLKIPEDSYKKHENSESIVKSPVYLSNPSLVLPGDKMDPSQGLIENNGMNTAHKPMKRDLKSVDMTEEAGKERGA